MKPLVIGGCAEANALCGMLQARGVPVLMSHAGMLSSAASPHPTRVGGFGGAEGLARFLRAGGHTHLLLAAHPFAGNIARNAVRAARAASVPICRVCRPPWRAGKPDLWHEFDSIEEVAAALPGGVRPFLALGRKDLSKFAGRTDLCFVWRSMEPVDVALRGEGIVGRPTPGPEPEAELFRARKIDLLVARNAGGALGRGKILAAEALGLPLFLLRRPPGPACFTVASPAAAVDWLFR